MVEQPLNGARRFLGQCLRQLGDVCEMATAEDVEIVVVGRILPPLCRRLNTTLSHHGVSITVTQLGCDSDLGALLLC